MRSRIGIPLVLAFAFVMFSQGCISTDFRSRSDLSAVSYPPIDASSVRVLSRPPSVPYTVLGEIEAIVSGYYSDEVLLSRIRKTAALKGANAIVFVRDTQMMAAVGEGDPDSAWRKRHSLVYEAVRLTDASAP